MSWCRSHCGTWDQILLPIGILLPESCSLVSVGCPLWQEDGSAICSAITQWSEPCRICNRTLLSHLRLPNLEGQVPVFISPRNRAAQLYPWALGSLYIVSYDSQGYGGGLLILPPTWRARSPYITYTYPSGAGWSNPKSRYDRWQGEPNGKHLPLHCCVLFTKPYHSNG
jgi:hypothetical protein